MKNVKAHLRLIDKKLFHLEWYHCKVLCDFQTENQIKRLTSDKYLTIITIISHFYLQVLIVKTVLSQILKWT